MSEPNDLIDASEPTRAEELAESTEPAETAEHATTAEPAELAKTAEPAELAKTAEPAELAETPAEAEAEESAEGETKRPPRKVDYLFVVTYGRSGSTLVQGLVNAMPGTLIRGENNFYVLPLYRSWEQLAKCQRSQEGSSGGPRWAFYGINEASLEEFAIAVRRLMTRQLTGPKRRRKVRIMGFKEIRWFQIEPKETARFFEFLELVFPDARYVLNRRDHAQVASSGFWQLREADDVMAAITRVEQIQDYLASTRPERSHLVRYENLTNEDSSVAERELRSLAEFVLGDYDDGVLTKMTRTMTKGHGPRPFGRSRETDPSPVTVSAGTPDSESGPQHA